MPPNAPTVACDEPLEMLRDREVALHGERADPLGLALEQLPAAGEHRDVGAFGGEGLRDRETHPGRGAADDRRAAGEPEIHAAKATREVCVHRPE